MAQKLKLQFGIERFVEGATKPDVRLTPVDQIVDLPDAIEGIILLMIMSVDANDVQPGDGEADFKISPKMLKQLGERAPAFLKYIPTSGSYNAFFRGKAVD